MMSLFDAVACLPVRPRRILVIGMSGAGESTAARRVATVLNIAHIENDGLFHGPGLRQSRLLRCVCGVTRQ
jgi:hypothetical protein